MIVNRDGNISIITQEHPSTERLVNQLEKSYDSFKNYHLIISLTSLERQTLQDIIEFLRLSNKHRAAKKSFVLVSDKANLDEMPDEIVVVPTLHEAYDIIEMEDIERDLGF